MWESGSSVLFSYLFKWCSVLPLLKCTPCSDTGRGTGSTGHWENNPELHVWFKDAQSTCWSHIVSALTDISSIAPLISWDSRHSSTWWLKETTWTTFSPFAQGFLKDCTKSLSASAPWWRKQSRHLWLPPKITYGYETTTPLRTVLPTLSWGFL